MRTPTLFITITNHQLGVAFRHRDTSVCITQSHSLPVAYNGKLFNPIIFQLSKVLESGQSVLRNMSRVINNWNRLPLSAASATEQRKFKITTRLICLLIYFSPYSIFAPIRSFWALCPFPISKCIHTFTHVG